MCKKSLSIILIATISLGLIGNVCAGSLTLQRTDKWLGGDWFHQTALNGNTLAKHKYNNGFKHTYNVNDELSELYTVTRSQLCYF